MADSQPTFSPTGPETDLSGRQLGDYQLVRRLGRGGMADVYLAEQRSLRRQVAFKVLLPSLAGDDVYVRRFHNEAQAAAALSHANIVQIYEVGCIDGVHFMAQEYVRGQNLQQLLGKRGPLEIPLAVNIMRQVAGALHKAAERGIVHRDIKPENIMLATSGEVKVADFGLARVVRDGEKVDLTQVGVTMGTPLYMSPEQVEGKTLDARSDLYSLGVSCYQMLAGEAPFQGETALSVAVQHLKKTPEQLDTRRPDAPGALCRIIHKMLAKDPAERYQAAAELLRDLRSLQIEGVDGEWPTGIEEWTTQELLAQAEARTLATQQLQAVMNTEANRLRRPAREWWFVAGTVLAFLVGGAVAWVSRAPSLLAVEDGAPRVVERLGTVEEQWNFAFPTIYGDDPVLREAALQSVIDYFPADEAPVNREFVNKARLQLGYLYTEKQTSGDDRLDEALGHFSELATQDLDPVMQARGLLGQAVVYGRQDQDSPAKKCLVDLAVLMNDLPRTDRSQLQSAADDALDEQQLRFLAASVAETTTDSPSRSPTDS